MGDQYSGMQPGGMEIPPMPQEGQLDGTYYMDPNDPAGMGEMGEVDSDGEPQPKKKKTGSGRRKIEIEYIEDKIRRHITFSKRKAGISKKAYELSRLTGAQVLLLISSER